MASAPAQDDTPGKASAPAEPLHHGAHLDRPDKHAREQFSISDLTSEFGCTARALRFYEDEGLISPARVGLTRVYSKRDRARLAWIMRAKNVGFSLNEIRESSSVVSPSRNAARISPSSRSSATTSIPRSRNSPNSWR